MSLSRSRDVPCNLSQPKDMKGNSVGLPSDAEACVLIYIVSQNIWYTQCICISITSSKQMEYTIIIFMSNAWLSKRRLNQLCVELKFPLLAWKWPRFTPQKYTCYFVKSPTQPPNGRVLWSETQQSVTQTANNTLNWLKILFLFFFSFNKMRSDAESYWASPTTYWWAQSASIEVSRNVVLR